jgi:hypothetical protein
VEPLTDLRYLAIGARGGNHDWNGRFEFAELNRRLDFVLGITLVAAGSPAFANADGNGDELENRQDVKLYGDCLLQRIDPASATEAGEHGFVWIPD